MAQMKGSWMLLVLIIQMAISGVLGFFATFYNEVNFISERIGVFMMAVAFLGFVVFWGILKFQDIYQDIRIDNDAFKALYPLGEDAKDENALSFKIEDYVHRWANHYQVRMSFEASLWLRKAIMSYAARSKDKQ